MSVAFPSLVEAKEFKGEDSEKQETSLTEGHKKREQSLHLKKTRTNFATMKSIEVFYPL